MALAGVYTADDRSTPVAREAAPGRSRGRLKEGDAAAVPPYNARLARRTFAPLRAGGARSQPST